MDPRPLALVTGASRGIGAATARALAPTHDVLLGGRDPVALESLAAELDGARAWPVDLTDDGSVAAAVAGLGLERLDVLVHSAGVGLLGTVAETEPDTWRRQFEVNVVAVAGLTRLLLPALRAARGDVVLVNSGSGLTARAGWGSYAASKFALRAFADALRAEEPELRVTSVHPGRVDTAMQRAVVAHEGGEYDGSRFLRPESVAAAILAAVAATDDAHVPEIVVRPR
ncbi:SDR family oxidoreductase [Pseudonocardia kujensis]|uniref:SDR family oxidoreductase n=1 Tax=Pseudonocardia kujensis TaxID=1128675 RepID=UPI001E62011F|nr:SDR family oxidoreductase [Pseudonocardia kujensis]MCE0765912.1 SDR family oxidoreductase [Pseudonocardia kujensis]